MKISWLAGCLLVTCWLCVGCGPAAEGDTLPLEPPSSAEEDGTASDSSAGELPQGADASEEDTPEKDTPEETAVEYTRDCSVTVDGGRELTLRLRGRTYSAWDYRVYAIDVLDGKDRIQTLSVREAALESLRQEGLEDTGLEEDYATSCWSEDGGLYGEDLNFDGSEDLRLLEYTGTVNSRYLCWLWDSEAGQYSFAFALYGYGVRLDSEAGQIVTESRDGWGQYDTDYYSYDGEGILRHVKQVHEDYTDRSEGEQYYVITTRELIDGAWVETDRQAVPNPTG